MVIKYFRRIARGGAALMAATLGFTLLSVAAAPSPASASTNNCGIVSCTVYFDKQATRSLDNLFSTSVYSVAEGVATAAACFPFGGPWATAACSVVTIGGPIVIKTAAANAVKIDGCLTVKYGIGVRGGVQVGGVGVALGAVTDSSSYCQAGVPLFPDGTLIKNASAPYVYVVYGGAKFLIPNPAAFTALGFSWSAIRAVSDKDFYSVPPLPKYGTILREQTLPTVYRIENGRKRAVSLSEYVNNGYGRYLHYVTDGQLVQIPG
jgi:hypothetical protein